MDRITRRVAPELQFAQSRPLLALATTLAVLAAAGFSSLVQAKSCNSQGNLRFVGTTADSARSVWLSATSAGAFRLDSAQGNQTVDSWSKNRRGLHLSLSPNVSNGNGGTHKLYDDGSSGGCLLDTQNQIGGFVLPPTFIPPTIARPPIGTLPPSGLMPTLPGGVRPPIGTLPPSGLMPTLPGGVTPPIGTLPPSGLMPTLPGGVTPPIGTLPPSGLMPTLPGGVTPPIGTLPPSGLMPTLPGGVTPPIGTLPPSGLMPTLPGGVTPPIGTLPPSGLMPTLPGGVTPPIGTLPPEGLMPTLPGGVMPPIGTLPPEGLEPGTAEGGELRLAAGQIYPVGGRCPPGTLEEGSASDLAVTGRCRVIGEQYSAPPSRDAVPLTPGRDLLDDTLWNSWVDTSYTRIRDRRDNQNLDGSGGVVLLGTDRRVDDVMVAGMMLSLENSRTDAYGGEQQIDVHGFMVGPYMSYQFSPAWSLYASFNLGHFNQDQQLSTLSGSGDVQRYALTLNAEGQYALDELYLRPKILLSYLHSNNEAYELAGAIEGTAISLQLPEDSYNSGGLQPSLELSRPFTLSNGRVFVPYVEAGVNYAFERPDASESYLTGLDEPSRFSGMLRLGARTVLGESSMLDFNSSYQSIGTPGLDVWEAEVLFSHGF